MPLVQNTTRNAAGDAIPGVSVAVTLTDGAGEQITGYHEGSIVARHSFRSESGTWEVELVPNEDIIPENSVYKVEERPPTGGVRTHLISVPSGAGPFDLTSLLADDIPALGSSAVGGHIADEDAHPVIQAAIEELRTDLDGAVAGHDSSVSAHADIRAALEGKADVHEHAPSRQVISIPGYTLAKYETGDWTRFSGSVLFGGTAQATTQNAERGWDIYLDAGYYTIELAHQEGTNLGIYSVRVDDVEVGTIDGYAATFVSRLAAVVDVMISDTGIHKISIVMATKNASSSGYLAKLNGLNILRTGDILPAVEVGASFDTSQFHFGVTYEQNNINTWENPASVAQAEGHLAALSAADPEFRQNQHVMGFGSGEVQAADGSYTWTEWNRRVGRPGNVEGLMERTGGVKVMTAALSPEHMRVAVAPADYPLDRVSAYSPSSWYEHKVDPAKLDDYAAHIVTMLTRYSDVEYVQVWNELKGYYNATLNRWDYEEYTAFYNAVYDAVKAFNPAIQVGGPYPVVEYGTSGLSHPSTLTGPMGTVDKRTLDVIEYWLANANGFDFIAVDGHSWARWPAYGYALNQFDDAVYFEVINEWIKDRAPGVPIWWSEWYTLKDPYNTSTGTPKQNSLQHQAAVVMNGVFALARSGTETALLWEPEANGFTAPGRHALWSSHASGRVKTPLYDAILAFVQAFPAGSPMHEVTLSDPSMMSAYASDTHVMVINRTTGTIDFTAGGADRSLGAYEIGLYAL